jgi:AraC family transcriptional regulator
MDELTGRPENGPMLLIAGLREHYTMETAARIPALWQRLVPHLGNIPRQIGDVTYGVVSRPRNGAGGFDYLAGVEVSGVGDLPGGFATEKIPAQAYTVYPHRQHVSKLRETMDAIWRAWIAVPGHQADYGLDVIERYGGYGEAFNPVTGLGDIEVWVPVGGRLGSL